MIGENEIANDYLKAEFLVPADYEDWIVNGIQEAGFKGSHVIEQPDSMIKLQLFFDSGINQKEIIAELEELIREGGKSFGGRTEVEIELTIEKTEDWLERNRASFPPVRISANLVVLPP
ncbi:MAG: hypothetical protein GF315_13895 [candidate division Zixibacteria bacterium]|nr:hypothetical protein [candidate division Zixibacteria bacterium]